MLRVGDPVAGSVERVPKPVAGRAFHCRAEGPTLSEAKRSRKNPAEPHGHVEAR
jgi:hypothetical protein